MRDGTESPGRQPLGVSSTAPFDTGPEVGDSQTTRGVGSGGFTYQSFPVAGIAARERFDYFQSIVENVFSPMQVTPHQRDPESFRAQIDVAELGHLRLARVASTPLSVQRRDAEVGRLSVAPYLVKFQLRGESIWRQRGREVHLRPGDFVIASMAEPYQLVLPGDYEMPVLALDVTTMRHLDPDPDRFLGQRMSGQDADCGLLSSFVAQVVTRMSRLQEPMISRVEANILDLLGAVMAARSGTAALTSPQQLARIRAYIDHHLHDRMLGPQMIASAFSISTRSLHALFADEPLSVSRYIKVQRLEACRRALEDPAIRRQRTLTDLAHDFGFYDLSHMTRSFREQFGTTPSDYLLTVAH